MELLHCLPVCLYYLPTAKTLRDKKIVDRKEAVAFFKDQDQSVRKEILFELIALGCVEDKDIGALVCVHTDKNGISIDRTNIDNFDIPQLSKLALESLLACSEAGGDFF
ncbi:hypothetical protein [Vibrio harveyi]|uniref:hypothetical protein n=1 Tax=Vibrio harveyi TaxID=669 RepID=UPI003CF93F50